MELATLIRLLDDPSSAPTLLSRWGLRNASGGRELLAEWAEAGLPLDLLAELGRQLALLLPQHEEPDELLRGLGAYLRAVRSPLAFLALIQRDASVLPMLLATLGLGPWCRQWLLEDPEALDVLREAMVRPPDRPALAANLEGELAPLDELRLTETALARFRRRHLLRIAYAEQVEGQPLAWVERQLTDLAEALLEAALRRAIAHEAASVPARSRVSGHEQSKHGGVPAAFPLRLTVLAVGSLGAGQPHYRLPLKLLLVYELREPATASDRVLYDLAERTARCFVRLLDEVARATGGAATELVALPDSPMVLSAHLAEDVVYGLENFGRTWHREQMLTARVVAGDRPLGESVLARLQPWLFRRYLSPADETGIRAMKRRLWQTARVHQDDWQDVIAACGGLRDLHGVLHLLQLLAGGDEPAVRTADPPTALEGLVRSGLLAPDEAATLRTTSQWLRRLHHGLQVHLGLEATALPTDLALLARLARRLNAAGDPAALLAEHRQQLTRSWQTLHKLLAGAFPQEGYTPREVDLLLDPAPTEAEVRAALGPFGFVDPMRALANLDELAREQVPFLSTRQCRHWLAEILPHLLCAVAATPSPDATLDQMARVSHSLGGKAILWELFRTQPSTLQLYVKLCAASPYLSGILTAQPGMLDELIDSLQREKLPTRQELEATWKVWRRGTAEPLRLLHDLKHAAHLRIGVRDLLGRDDIEQTAAALSDVAQVCLKHVLEEEYDALVPRLGTPTPPPGVAEDRLGGLVVLGLGRLGARELNYHSQLPLLFVYPAEGNTRPPAAGRREASTTHQHFFTQLAQRVIKRLTELTPQGRLYAADLLLRPLGIGGGRAVSVDELRQHFQQPHLPIGQWAALCQARAVCGSDPAAGTLEVLIRQLLQDRPLQSNEEAALLALREELAQAASPRNLKRAAGGTLDITLAVAGLQLRHARSHPQVLCPGTLPALAALARAGLLPMAWAETLDHHFRFLRRIEAGLRLLDTARRHDLPEDDATLAQLALLVGHANPPRLRQQCQEVMAQTRDLFLRLLAPS